MEIIELLPARVHVTSVLKKAMLAGEYRGGEELNIQQISERLGVSRTPVREAFQILANEGLIQLRMNRRAVVNRIDEKFINDHYSMRILLETEAAGLAAERGMDAASLLERLDELGGRIETVECAEYVRLNQDIHLGIWRAADNGTLFRLLSSLWNGPSTGAVNSEIEHFRLSTVEHINILSSIARRDSDSARRCMRGHLLRSRDNMLRSFANKV